MKFRLPIRVMPLVGAVAIMASLLIGLTGTSKVAAALPPPIKDVAYGSDPLQKLDIYSAKVPNSPVVVFVHGGGWTTNDKSDVGTQASALRQQGNVIFNINYRLDSATVGAFPMEIDDVKAAAQYAITNAAQYNGDPSKIILLGGSAGGQLVGMAAEQLNDAASGTVKAVVSLSGPTDFVSLIQDDKNGVFGTKKTGKDFAANVPQALGCALNDCTVATETQWSPASHVTAANCPAGGWLIFNSDAELIPLDQPNAMEAALQQNGCPVTKTILPGTDHAFSYWGDVKPAIASFIDTL
jgi:acetyl esterase